MKTRQLIVPTLQVVVCLLLAAIVIVKARPWLLSHLHWGSSAAYSVAGMVLIWVVYALSGKALRRLFAEEHERRLEIASRGAAGDGIPILTPDSFARANRKLSLAFVLAAGTLAALVWLDLPLVRVLDPLGDA